MTKLTTGFIAGLIASFLVAVPSAHAFVITFDFNTLADGASNSSIQTYMRNLITATAGTPAGASVTVTGAVGEANYTGDSHVVGPVSGSVVSSETLGTSNGGVHHAGLDTFIINNSSSSEIKLVFNFPIYSLSFDYEIFPDGTCPNSSCSAANWPDFTFTANGVLQFETLGILPGNLGTYPHSPASGATHTEPAPQFLGQSGYLSFPGGVTTLEFIDWPVTIGIDNLVISPSQIPVPPSSVPEPGSLVLVLVGLLGLALNASRHRDGA